MNILIIGDFSAFGQHLKAGLVELGHNVIVVSNGDDFKRLPQTFGDISIPEVSGIYLWGHHIPKSQLLFVPKEQIHFDRTIKQLGCCFDIIVVINYAFLSNSLFHMGVNIKYLRKMKRMGAKIIMSCCGGDPALKQYYHHGGHKYGKVAVPDIHVGSRKLFDELIHLSDSIIPTSYEYYESIMSYCRGTEAESRITTTIPLPVKYIDADIVSCVGRKIVIMHGVIRRKIKGSVFFEEALDKLQTLYPELVDIRIVSHLPYEEYIKLYEKVDILLDQTNSYGFGMNAVMGLMAGKIVLSGNEPESERSINLGEIPIINAKPDSDYLFTVLESLIKNPERIDELKMQSRLFAIKYLEASVIAQRYLDSLSFN